MKEIAATVELIPRGADPLRDAHRNFWADIKWRTLHCLIETSGHLPISELARKSALPVGETVRALEAMEVLGAIQKTANGYVQTTNSYKRTNITKMEKMDELVDYFNISHQITNKILQSGDPESVYTKRVLYTSNKAVVKQLQADIHMAIEKFKQSSEEVKGSWDAIYAISLAVTPMTEEV